jgi:hypothetical protein
MAGPMNWLRRYQKIVLVVLAVVAMLGFVVADPLMKFFSGGQQTRSVAVRTSFGDISEQQLYHMVENRAVLNRFLENLAGSVAQNLATSRQIQAPPQQVQFFILRQMEDQGAYGQQFVDERAVVRTMLLARRAEDMGMTVSNDAIFDFLRRMTFNAITPDQVRQVIASMKLRQRQVFDQLRTVLLASRMHQLLFAINDVQGVTPAMRWNYFQRLHRQASAEVIPLPVANFIGQVAEPKESDLRQLYAKYKNDYPRPGQGEPGFRIPPKGNFQGFKAVYEKFSSPVEVTEQEIEDYYNTHQNEFPYSGLDEENSQTSTEAAPPSETSPPASETAPSQTQDDSSSAPPPEGSEQQTTPQAAPPSPPNKPDAPSEPNSGGGGDDAGGSEPPPSSQPQSEQPPAAEKSDASANPETTPPTTAPTEGEAKVEPATPPADATKIEPSDEFNLPDDIRGGEAPKYDPLWKVHEEIRQKLIAQKANEKIDEIFDKLTADMDDYAQKLELYEIEKEEQQQAGKVVTVQKPAPLDFNRLAAEYGVETFETGLISPFEADATELGQSTVDGRPFPQAAFDSLPRFSVRRSQAISGDRFLFWKTEATKDKVPSFLEARDAVLQAWKTSEARKLALKRAVEMAAEADKSGKTLKELYGDDSRYEVIETGFFSWMTEQKLAAQFGPTPVQLGSVKGVDQAGSDFMRTAFSLKPGQAGAALNAPEDVAYVIRITDERPGEQELLAEFLKTGYEQYAQAGRLDNQESLVAFMSQIENESHVQWERPPHDRDVFR